jgi:hypothetical protein
MPWEPIGVLTAGIDLELEAEKTGVTKESEQMRA